MIETSKAQLIGFLGADPERKENGNGNPHLVLSVATDTSWKKPNSENGKPALSGTGLSCGANRFGPQSEQRRQGAGSRRDSLPRI